MLGGYRIERLLGRGGMGSVFLAYDTTLHRHVALKTLDGLADGDAARSRLLREARSAAALSHPNICTIYEIGDASGAAFIAMEYVDGRSLRDRLDAGALPLDETLRYATQAADALGFAHDRGVVHRDFKAANVIVAASGGLKIVDFGLARRDDVQSSAATTMASLAPPGTAAGTPYAMAPEQVRGEPADGRTDLWALGVILHEMVSGRKPFEGATTPELFSSILRDAPAPLPGTVPAQLRSVVARCLEKAPEQRYQHAGEVRAALEMIPRGTGQSSPRRWHQSIRRWRASATMIVAAAALLALSLAGARNWIAGGSDGRTPVRLAVLPLDNLSGDPGQEHFSDGLTEAISAGLSRLPAPGLSVIAGSLSKQYKRSLKPPDQIGRELNATTILQGSVARSGARVRIAVELVSASDARPLWSQTYEGLMDEVFRLERNMSDDVLRALRVEPPPAARTARAESRPVNPDAYDLYLRGLSHALRNSELDLDRAIALLEQSASLDPTFVPTQAYLALAYGNKSSIYRPGDSQWEEKGFAAAQKALDLDAEAPEAHYARAMMLWRPSHGFPSREALQELRSALAARPNFDEAWHQRGVILMHVGHLDAGARTIQRAVDINPGNTLARFRFGPIYVYQQRFEDAIAAITRVPREAFPAQWTFQRAWALISLGRLEEAGRVVDGAIEGRVVDGAIEGNPVDQGGVLHAARAMLRAKRGDRSGAEADVAEAVRVGRNFIHFHHTAYSIGAVYTTLGEFDKAQEWIENAANDGFPNYTYFENDVHLERLRSIPRFRAFLAKLRREWEHIPGESE